MTNDFSYERLEPIDKDTFEKLLESNDPAIIGIALLRAVNSIDDRIWLEDRCLEMLSHEDQWVAKNAVTCIGHIARIFEKINTDRVVPMLKQVQAARPFLSGNVEDALDDIKVFTS